jgi:hypothetical protein
LMINLYSPVIPIGGSRLTAMTIQSRDVFEFCFMGIWVGVGSKRINGLIWAWNWEKISYLRK